jgi:pantetheine-phosphate adenylyltransferase
MDKRRVGVYPGTFDPITYGHIDIIRRACHLVDRLIVAVAVNAGKEPLFAFEERLEIVREEIAGLENDGSVIEVHPFDNLLMDFAVQVGAGMVIRGLRAVSDFEYEFQMTGMNACLNPDIETVFLMATERHQFIASRLVQEVCRLGGDISSFVSPNVQQHLVRALAKDRAGAGRAASAGSGA